jgi:hypothetical protein
MLLAFFAGAGYTLTLDLQPPQQWHPIAFHLVALPAASGAEPAPGFYQRPLSRAGIDGGSIDRFPTFIGWVL